MATALDEVLVLTVGVDPDGDRTSSYETITVILLHMVHAVATISSSQDLMSSIVHMLFVVVSSVVMSGRKDLLAGELSTLAADIGLVVSALNNVTTGRLGNTLVCAVVPHTLPVASRSLSSGYTVTTAHSYLAVATVDGFEVIGDARVRSSEPLAVSIASFLSVGAVSTLEGTVSSAVDVIVVGVSLDTLLGGRIPHAVTGTSFSTDPRWALAACGSLMVSAVDWGDVVVVSALPVDPLTLSSTLGGVLGSGLALTALLGMVVSAVDVWEVVVGDTFVAGWIP